MKGLQLTVHTGRFLVIGHHQRQTERKPPKTAHSCSSKRTFGADTDRVGNDSSSEAPDEDLAWARVLIVDDQPANVALLERVLRRIGVERAIGITDPRATVDHYRSFRPDLILLDLHMPHLDGLQVLQMLNSDKQADSFVPVVILTADATDAARQQALSAGATDFLTKPFDHTEVVLRVRNLLRTRRLHTALQDHNAELRLQLEQRAEFERRMREERAERERRIRNVLDRGSIMMLFQPIVRLSDGAAIGVEALARFPTTPQRPPDEWFAEAALTGLGVELEIAAINAALPDLSKLPAGAYMALNVSPATINHPEMMELIGRHAERIVLELTEHEAVDGYGALLASLKKLRGAGVRLAVDDAGSGYAGLRHILEVQPDIIKLDLALTRAIHTDPARRALAAALVAFGRETGASIVAEGIELPQELQALRDLEVGFGQGFHLGRPGPLIPSREIGIGVA